MIPRDYSEIEIMPSGYAANKKKPGAEWSEKDQRYYMEGEKERMEDKRNANVAKSD